MIMCLDGKMRTSRTQLWMEVWALKKQEIVEIGVTMHSSHPII